MKRSLWLLALLGACHCGEATEEAAPAGAELTALCATARGWAAGDSAGGLWEKHGAEPWVRVGEVPEAVAELRREPFGDAIAVQGSAGAVWVSQSGSLRSDSLRSGELPGTGAMFWRRGELCRTDADAFVCGERHRRPGLRLMASHEESDAWVRQDDALWLVLEEGGQVSQTPLMALPSAMAFDSDGELLFLVDSVIWGWVPPQEPQRRVDVSASGALRQWLVRDQWMAFATEDRWGQATSAGSRRSMLPMERPGVLALGPNAAEPVLGSMGSDGKPVLLRWGAQ